MLRVYGAQIRAGAPRLGCEDVARHHEHFLIRQRHSFPGADGGQRGAQAGGADRGHNDEINVRVSRHLFHLGPARRRTAAGDALHQVLAFAPGTHETRPEFPHLLLEQRHIATRRERDHVEAPRQRPHDIERLAAY